MERHTNSTGGPYCLTEEEVATALREAKARGLPDGWTVKLDKRKRRKWIAPNGRSCDSIPKAVGISIELGLLPPDTPIPKPAPGRKQNPNTKRRNSSTNSSRKQKSPSSSAAAATAGTTTTTPSTIKSNFSSTSSTSSDWDKPILSAIAFQQKQKHQRDSSSNRRVEDDDDDDEEEDDDGDGDDVDDEISDPGDETDPETTLDVAVTTTSLNQSDNCRSMITTIAWDPKGLDGRKIGWKIRILTTSHHQHRHHPPRSRATTEEEWLEGRIIRYDPHSHKHKIQWHDNVASSGGRNNNCVWVRLRMEPIQLSTQLCWAHVKGYAWWPALIVESNVDSNPPLKEGFCQVEFFGSAEMATLRQSPDCILPFDQYEAVNAVVARHRKKRNAKAHALACQEQTTISNIRNEAARWYASKAFELANTQGGNNLLGKRVQLFRSDVHYPYGDTVIGTVRKYSAISKKWLLSYEVSEQTRQKYPASWINLLAKEHAVKPLDNNTKNEAIIKELTTTTTASDLDLLPYLRGLEYRCHNTQEPTNAEEGTVAFLAKAERERCRGCVDYWRSTDSVRATCCKCDSSFHLGCIDPPISTDVWQRMVNRDQWVCPNCITCKGCLQNDIVFGCSVVRPIPPTLSLPKGDVLELCTTCTAAYQAKQYCPNCAHTWDDVAYQKWQKRMQWQEQHRKPRGRGRKRKRVEWEEEMEVVDQPIPSDVVLVPTAGDCSEGRPVDRTWYYSESSNWGYTTGDMLVCDSCSLWVHAGCASLTEEEYELTSSGKHPIYSKEFLCRACCKRRCNELIEELQRQDGMRLFAEPVTEKVAPNDRYSIENPSMDLQTMADRAKKDDKYLNYAWVREAFELMVLNVLICNPCDSKFWLEGQRYFQAGQAIFEKIGKGAPPSKYHAKVLDHIKEAEGARKAEDEELQPRDKSPEPNDIYAGSQAVTVSPPSSEVFDIIQRIEGTRTTEEEQVVLDQSANKKEHVARYEMGTVTPPLSKELDIIEKEEDARKMMEEEQVGQDQSPNNKDIFAVSQTETATLPLSKELDNMQNAKEASNMDEEHVQKDPSTEKIDLVAESQVGTIALPKLRDEPPDEKPCLPFTELKLKPVDAYYKCWVDCCFTCGSSGASDTMLFCVDCGEAFHSFCVSTPIHSMTSSLVSSWRCPNCKICERSGCARLRMLVRLLELFSYSE